MKKRIKELFSVLFPVYIIFNLIFMLIGSYLVLEKYIFIKLFSYGYIVLLILNLIIIFIIFIKKKYQKNIIDIFLVLIMIFAIISTIFAYKQTKALFGEWGRYEGLFVICYYMTTVFITSFLRKEDRKMIVYSIIGFGLIQCFYSIFQKLDLFNARTMIHNGYRWATGFATNPNFFGTLMLLCISYAIGLYIDSNKKIPSIIFLVLSYLLSIGLFLSKARSSFVGLVVVLIVTFIYAIKFKKIKRFIILFLVLVFSLTILQHLRLTSVVNRFWQTKTEIKEIAKGNVDEGYGSGRIEIWTKTAKLIPKYIIHGIGVDNFANIIDGNPIYKRGKVVDKAHNEYLQILITMGIFSLISYLCLHFIIIKNGIKNSLKNKEIYLLLPIIGYIVQAQFNISVIEVAPIFYIGLGLLVER